MKKLAIAAVSAIAIAACGGGSGGTEVSSVWARTSAPGQTSGAIYFDLTVSQDDRLVGASVPDDVATRAEIHEVVAADTGMDDTEMSEGSGDMDMGDMEMGAMRMQELPNGLALTGDETVSFEPGSYHVMLPELIDPLEAGDEFELTLEFENVDDVTVSVEVADDAP